MPEALDVLAVRTLPLDVVVLANTEETTVSQVFMVKGDTRPTLEFTVRDENGTIIAITGATPRFRIRRKGSTTVLVTRVCTVTDGPGGKCTFDWAAIDWNAGTLDASGWYDGELEVTFSDATIGTVFQIVEIYVRDQVG